MAATAKLIEPQSAEDRSAAYADAAFEDGSHIRVWLDDGVPDEDGQLRYVVGVDAPDGSDVHYSVDLWSGNDGQVDYLQALRVLLDMWLDLADEDATGLPDWWTLEFNQWVYAHIDELDELHAALLADRR